MTGNHTEERFNDARLPVLENPLTVCHSKFWVSSIHKILASNYVLVLVQETYESVRNAYAVGLFFLSGYQT